MLSAAYIVLVLECISTFSEVGGQGWEDCAKHDKTKSYGSAVMQIIKKRGINVPVVVQYDQAPGEAGADPKKLSLPQATGAMYATTVGLFFGSHFWGFLTAPTS